MRVCDKSAGMLTITYLHIRETDSEQDYQMFSLQIGKQTSHSGPSEQITQNIYSRIVHYFYCNFAVLLLPALGTVVDKVAFSFAPMH